MAYIFLVGLWLLLQPIGASGAERWTQYDLPGLTFSAPESWEITYNRQDVEYNFASPDGTYTLWVRWWFPDEPLLGYDDIVFHDFLTLADQKALLTRTESDIDRFMSIAFPEHKNAEGEIILFQLFSPIDLPVEAQAKMMNLLIDQLTIQGVSAQPQNPLEFSQNAQDPARIAKPAKGAGSEPGQEWLIPLNDRFGGDCRLEPMESWSHPTKAVMEDANVNLHFVALCQNGVYPVFGVDFPYDPQGATDDYFHPLYIKMMTANAGWSYSFLSVADNMLSNVFVHDKTTLSLAVEDLFPSTSGHAD